MTIPDELITAAAKDVSTIPCPHCGVLVRLDKECWCIWPYPVSKYGYDMGCPTHPIEPFKGHTLSGSRSAIPAN